MRKSEKIWNRNNRLFETFAKDFTNYNTNCYNLCIYAINKEITVVIRRIARGKNNNFYHARFLCSFF